ncbi:MAG TPA: glycine betaine ABC transporter substrate-binding protein [Nitrospirota bacterium]|nr:glycine betaine ABC transporter substrate-binding protein [Nitrospirota bacterium]
MSRKAAVFFSALALFLAVSAPAQACVGKSLVIGSVNRPNLSVMSEMLGILITERTGTTVVLRSFDSFPSLMEAMKKGDVDIMIDYSGRCYVDVLGMQPDGSSEKVFSTVKEVYQRDKNQVWLEPFGFSETGVIAGKGSGAPAFAAPIVRKDTLAKFPALPRVMNKLAGKIDNGIITRLTSEGTNGKAKKATRKFLKDNKLI